MTKSKLLVIVVVAAGLAGAQDATEPRPGVRTQAELLAALDNSIWVADGTAAEKQIYVIAAPWCPVCRELYQRSRGLAKQVQFRWVEMDPRDAKSADYLAEAASGENSGVLEHMYVSKRQPPHAEARFRDNVIRYNFLVSAAIDSIVNDLLRAQQPQNPEQGFPTLIWLSEGGVRVQSGLSESLDPVVRSVVARPEAAKIVPASRRFLSTEYKLDPVPAKHYYAKADGVPIFADPDPVSQVVFALPKDYGFPGTGRLVVNGEAWIAFEPGDFPPPGLFVRERDVFPEPEQ
jgi:thiol-disulfide isomerase/thioredoxin